MSPAPTLKFTLACPEHNQVFESADFRIVDNRGVVAGPDGSKVLEAKVALDRPSPWYGIPTTFIGREGKLSWRKSNRRG